RTGRERQPARRTADERVAVSAQTESVGGRLRFVSRGCARFTVTLRLDSDFQCCSPQCKHIGPIFDPGDIASIVNWQRLAYSSPPTGKLSLRFANRPRISGGVLLRIGRTPPSAKANRQLPGCGPPKRSRVSLSEVANGKPGPALRVLHTVLCPSKTLQSQG